MVNVMLPSLNCSHQNAILQPTTANVTLLILLWSGNVHNMPKMHSSSHLSYCIHSQYQQFTQIFSFMATTCCRFSSIITILFCLTCRLITVLQSMITLAVSHSYDTENHRNLLSSHYWQNLTKCHISALLFHFLQPTDKKILIS